MLTTSIRKVAGLMSTVSTYLKHKHIYQYNNNLMAKCCNIATKSHISSQTLLNSQLIITSVSLFIFRSF